LGDPAPFDRGFPHVGKNLKFIGVDLPGGMQGSWTVPAYTLHPLPDTLPLEHGALIEPAAVACHDVKMGKVKEGELCVVIGGGPIGTLIALVAKSRGANVVLSELNEKRLELVRRFGIHVVNPRDSDLVQTVKDLSQGAMADCVFEVSGSGPGVEIMTRLPNVRGRIVMVAIHPQPRPVDLFRFFWSELKLIGARLYEEEDFDEAIRLAGSGALHLDGLITSVRPIEETGQAFAELVADPAGMKTLIRCS
jgi:2-desacetyl-2-hydroxyethyl bacteriochlorophyllide A dehydrogenase